MWETITILHLPRIYSYAHLLKINVLYQQIFVNFATGSVR